MSTATELSIAYETPVAKPPPRTLAATMILFGGLSLIGLGGCFLIGVMMIIERYDVQFVSHPAPLTPAEVGFIAVLSLAALGCFVGATALLMLGVKGLMRIIG